MKDLTDFVNLREKDLREEGLFVAEGHLLVERAIAGGCGILGIIADEKYAPEAEQLAGSGIPVRLCGKAEINAIAGFPFHKGLLAVARRPAAAPAGESIAGGKSILALPAVTDPGNLGTLLRSALAFGFNTVLIGPLSCDPYNRKALRSSMGAVFSLSLRGAGDEALEVLSGRGFRVLAAEMRAEALVAGEDYSVTDTERTAGTALVLGNEYDGIPDAWRRHCTGSMRIPVSEAVDSLNVAVAGSILMWELSPLRLR